MLILSVSLVIEKHVRTLIFEINDICSSSSSLSNIAFDEYSCTPLHHILGPNPNPNPAVMPN